MIRNYEEIYLFELKFLIKHEILYFKVIYYQKELNLSILLISYLLLKYF